MSSLASTGSGPSRHNLSDSPIDLGVIGQRNSATREAQNLIEREAENSDVAECADGTVLNTGSDTLCAVLDQADASLGADFLQHRDVARKPVGMDGYYRASLVAHRGLGRVNREIEIEEIDIRGHRLCTHGQNSIHHSVASKSGNDHFAIRCDVQCQKAGL